MSAPRPEESHRVGAGEAASPGYAIEESDRAKHVRLRASVRDGSLIVVIPKGFDRRRIPEVVREKRRWIERARKRVAEQRQQPDSDRTDGLPVLIRLRAVDEEWHVEYRRQRGRAGSAGTDGRRTLVVCGAIEDETGCGHALRRWVHDSARFHLVPRLLELSKRHRLPIARVTVRSQRTRWASCSERNSISLNEKLVFLPPDLVAQVMLHELCHTAHHNHSKEFWGLVESLSPQCTALEAELRTAWRYVPTWVDE